MQVTRLKLAGFKSFAEPTEIRIEPGLTGVVGPNGCGKSNIVDAIRWVMGESSARGLRGDEMEDVIFAGSDARPGFDFAEVSLLLEPQSESEGAALEVARRLGRGVGSTFRMNGREARSRDVARLLADSAASARSAAIVGQGQIGALVEARPQERQRLLAEAAGIGGLRSRRREAELRLDAATANLATLGEREATLSEQTSRLQKQVKDAKRWRELNQRHRELQVLLALARYLDAERELTAAKDALAVAETAARDAGAAARTGAEAAAAASARLPGLRETEQGLASARARLEERLDLRRAEVEAARAAVERSQARGQELADDLAREERAAGEAAAALTGFEAERDAAPERLRELDVAVSGVQERAAAAERALEEATATWQACERNRSRTNELVEAGERAAAAAASTASVLETRLATLSQEITAVEARLAEQSGPSEDVAELARARHAFDAAETEHLQARSGLEAALVAQGEAARAQVEARARLQAATTARERRREREEQRAETGARVQALDERYREAATQKEAASAQLSALDLDALRDAAVVAERLFADAEAQLPGRRSSAEQAEAKQRHAVEALAQARTTEARIEAELQGLGPPAPGVAETRPALASDLVEPCWHAAVAAAVGDDALAPIDDAADEAWRETVPEVVADLPGPVVALAEVVSAPGSLAARLALTGVCDDVDTAERLHAELRPGQRLTTRQGGLWRWDGYRRRPGVEPRGSDLIARELRRAALRAELANVAQTCTEADAAAAAAQRHSQEARGAAQLAADEMERRRAAQHAATFALERATAEAARLATLSESLDATLAATAADLAPLRDRLAALGEGAGDEGEGQSQVDREDEAAAALQGLTARLDAADGELAAARSAIVEAEGRLAERRAALDAAATTAESSAKHRAQAARAAEQELAALLERRRDAEGRLADARAELEAAGASSAQYQADRQAADAAADAAGEALSAVRKARDEAATALLATGSERQAAADRVMAVEHDIGAARERLRTSRDALGELRRRQEALAAEQAALADPARQAAAAAELAAGIAAAEEELEAAVAARAEAESAADSALERQRHAEAAAAATAERLEAARLKVATAEARQAAADAAGRERLKSSPADLLADQTVAAEARAADAENVERELVRLEAARDRLGAVNLRADDELQTLEEDLRTLAGERGDLERAVGELRRAIGELNREGRTRLLEAFRAVEQHFGRLFTQLFGGGRAELALAEDPDDPLGAGLELGASPPGKRLQALSLLSGGEKALTAIALIFAFFRTQPAPLCVLDEVDAPLDDANVGRLADLMAEIAAATGTRFVVVTHHPLTMARMHRLYGVTMVERGLSSLVSVELEAAIALRESGTAPA